MKINNIAFATNKVSAIVRYSESMINEKAKLLIKAMEKHATAPDHEDDPTDPMNVLMTSSVSLTNSMLGVELMNAYVDRLRETVETPLSPEMRLTALNVALASIMPKISVSDWSLHANFSYMTSVLHYKLDLPEDFIFGVHSAIASPDPDVDRVSFENLFESLGKTLEGAGSFRPFSHDQSLFCYTWFILEELNKGGTYFDTLRNQWASHMYNLETVVKRHFPKVAETCVTKGFDVASLSEMLFLRLCNEVVIDVLSGTGYLFNADGSVFETIDQYYKDIDNQAKLRKAKKVTAEMSHADFLEMWKERLRASGMTEEEIATNLPKM